MKIFLPFFLLLAAVGCKQFETQRISSQDILREESQELNWKEVDQYPAFEECREFLREETAKACFGQKVKEYVYARLEDKQPVVTRAIHDTLLLHLIIAYDGEARIDSLEVDSSVVEQLPEIQAWIQQSINSLPEIYPATKRGIPVTTKFRIPLVIQTD